MCGGGFRLHLSIFVLFHKLNSLEIINQLERKANENMWKMDEKHIKLFCCNCIQKIRGYMSACFKKWAQNKHPQKSKNIFHIHLILSRILICF